MSIRFSLFLISSLLLGCASDSSSNGDAYELQVSNQSQFELQHLFFHEDPLDYKSQESQLTEPPLGIDQALNFSLPGKATLYVTVTRVKHEGGPLRAYTTTQPLVMDESKVLEYFDTEFRVSVTEIDLIEDIKKKLEN